MTEEEKIAEKLAATLEEISRIKKTLSLAEDTDPKYMTPAVRDLRHHVMYTHSAIESAMDTRLGQYLTSHMTATRGEFQDFDLKLRDVTDEMDFYKKVKVLQSWGYIPKLHDKLMAVNNYRIKFAHPSSYQDDLKNYRKEEEALKVYKALESALNELNALIASEHPEWYKHD